MTTTGTATFNLDMPTDQYFSGLFDGEGCVSVHLAKAGYINVTVQVAMCDRAPIVALYERFGGRFNDGKQKTKHGRPVYVWAVTNAKSVEALEVFSKHGLVKNAVSAAALTVAKTMLNNPARGVLTKEEKQARIEVAKFVASVNKPVGRRRIFDDTFIEQYLSPKRMGGGKAVRLSDGRVFPTVSDAAQALGVSISAVSVAKRNGTKTAGLKVEAA